MEAGGEFRNEGASPKCFLFSRLTLVDHFTSKFTFAHSNYHR